MPGRPKKTVLTPVFSVTRKRWILDIPAHIAGKRDRKAFKSQSEALEAASKIAQGVEVGAVYTAPVTNASTTIAKTTAAFLAEMEEQVKNNLCSKDNLTTMRWGLTRLTAKFGSLDPVHLTPAMIDSWLKGTEYKTRGRFNLFAAGRTFYNSRPMRDLCPTNPFRDVPPKKDKNARLPILTPEEMRTLLSLDLKPFFKAWIVCGGFSGIRSCEFDRISYESIDYDHKEIVIREEESKQGNAARPRDIPVYPAFERHMPQGKGPLNGGVSWKRVDDEMAVALKALGWKHWKKNCLRHSFASYALAQSRDPSKTAYEMGHESPKLLFSTYANKVARQDAEAWWAL
jgi:integrase